MGRSQSWKEKTVSEALIQNKGFESRNKKCSIIAESRPEE